MRTSRATYSELALAGDSTLIWAGTQGRQRSPRLYRKQKEVGSLRWAVIRDGWHGKVGGFY